MIPEKPNTSAYWDDVYRDECARDAQREPGYTRDYRGIHAAIVSLMPDTGRVLDVGCGPGLLCRRMKRGKPAVRVTGVDFSQFVIDRNAERDAPLGIEYRRMDIRDSLDELGTGWDAVTMCEVVEHLEHPHEVVPRIVDLISERGRFLVTCPHDDRVPSTEHLWRWGHDEIFHLLEPHSDAVTFMHFAPPFDKWLLAYLDRRPQPETPPLSANPARQRAEDLLVMKTKVRSLRETKRKQALRIERLLERVQQRDERIASLRHELRRLTAGDESGALATRADEP